MVCGPRASRDKILTARFLLLAAVVVFAGACAYDRYEEDAEFTAEHLRMDNPVVKIRAMRQFVAEKRTHFLAQFIELLDDEDSVVRGQAEWAIQELTGLTTPPTVTGTLTDTATNTGTDTANRAPAAVPKTSKRTAWENWWTHEGKVRYGLRPVRDPGEQEVLDGRR